MTYFEIVLIAVGLAMDAFAVAMCKGIKMRPFSAKQTLLIALFFGGAQALMPLIGWFLGAQFEQYIVAFDHWLAFILLGFIGGKMIFEALKRDADECDCCEKKFDILELFIMAIATSIDALVVGVTFAFLRVDIISAILLIGVVTFIFSAIGLKIGNKFGCKYKSKAELAGGIILIAMGLSVLLEHTGIL